MKLFMLKTFLLACIMFVCVLTGMQLANNGIHDMKGYEDPSFQSAFIVKENEKGKNETTIFGNNVSSHDLQKKREQLEKMETFNFFSSIGKKIAEGIESTVTKSLDIITK
ncbi:YqxA family protein [Bacillus sp. B15-48]|uniref:YqxA family protein n=1 Tax=Bacillus sp. B15-48 TaxID=1548601 RepID=UPI00193F1E54|nr:YqxA family protein [Bacillus sp. B15-48]MBM4762352.1 DUF3679 domain-containing protein [Bacillus sp. B15-48]